MIDGKIRVTASAKRLLEEKIESLRDKVNGKIEDRVEIADRRQAHMSELSDDSIVPQLEDLSDNLEDFLSSYEATLKNLNVVKVDETKNLYKVQLGTYIVIRWVEDGHEGESNCEREVERYYVSGLAYGNVMLGKCNFIGEEVGLGQALLTGNVREGNTVEYQTDRGSRRCKVLEISWGDSTFSLEERLKQGFEYARESGKPAYIDSEIKWIDRKMTEIRDQYLEVIPLPPGKKAETLKLFNLYVEYEPHSES